MPDRKRIAISESTHTDLKVLKVAEDYRSFDEVIQNELLADRDVTVTAETN